QRGEAQAESAAVRLGRVLHRIAAEELPEKVHGCNFVTYVKEHLPAHLEALVPDLQRAHLSWQQAYRLAQEGALLEQMEALSPTGRKPDLPTRERQIRALLRLRQEPKKALQAWERVKVPEGPDPSGA